MTQATHAPASRKSSRGQSQVAASVSPVLPLDRTEVASELRGHNGSNRAPVGGLQIEAKDDIEAMRCFLAEYDRSSSHRIYARECERLVLWSIHDRQKPVSSLSRQDFEDYLSFLAGPEPSQMWCGPKAPKESDQWRPFVGGLQESATLTAMAAINSWFKYMVDSGYLQGNPLGLIRQRRRKMQGAESSRGNPKAIKSTDEADKVERYLDEQMWQAVTEAVEALPRSTPMQVAQYERLRFMLALLVMLGPRAGELETHTMSSFRNERGLWWWRIVGKGGKEAKIPVPDDMIQALMRYRKHLGLPLTPQRKESTPLLCALPTSENGVRPANVPLKGITARRLNQILKEIFAAGALRLPESALDKAERLRQASAHWGRHTAITGMVDHGINEAMVQKGARHSDRRTTQRYIHTGEAVWHAEAQKHRLHWSESPADASEKQPAASSDMDSVD